MNNSVFFQKSIACADFENFFADSEAETSRYDIRYLRVRVAVHSAYTSLFKLVFYAHCVFVVRENFSLYALGYLFGMNVSILNKIVSLLLFFHFILLCFLLFAL